MKGVGTVPASAISFTPDTDVIKKYYTQNEITKSVPEIKTGNSSEKYVWVKNNDGTLAQKLITIGSNDGINVQVLSGLNASDKIITTMEVQQTAAASDSETSESPFMPKRPGNNKKSSDTKSSDSKSSSSSNAGPPPGN